MKKVLTHIVLASFVAVPSLLAAEAIGLVPSLPFGAETLIGGYVAGGVLAFALHDYGHGLTPRQPRLRKSSRPRSAAQPAEHHPVVGWEHHTISA